MSTETEIIPFEENKIKNIDLNKTIEDGQAIISDLQKMKIKEATYENGMYYKEDKENKSTVLATDGIAIQQNEHTTVIVLRNEGSSKDDALKEIQSTGATQKMLGSFSGKSQQEVSKLLSEDSTSIENKNDNKTQSL